MLARLLLETSDDKDKATSNGNPPEIAAKRGHTNLTDDGWLIREQQHRVSWPTSRVTRFAGIRSKVSDFESIAVVHVCAVLLMTQVIWSHRMLLDLPQYPIL